MAEERINYTYSLAELAEALVQKQGLHEGIWGVAIHFGLGAGNTAAPGDPTTFLPTAFLPITGIGLQNFPIHVKGITVDAAEVNPLQPGLPLEG
jgi:hypothetical protein